jgi:hypothetical protein
MLTFRHAHSLSSRRDAISLTSSLWTAAFCQTCLSPSSLSFLLSFVSCVPTTVSLTPSLPPSLLPFLLFRRMRMPGPDCGMPDWYKALLILYMLSMLLLFTRFFVSTAHPQPSTDHVWRECILGYPVVAGATSLVNVCLSMWSLQMQSYTKPTTKSKAA